MQASMYLHHGFSPLHSLVLSTYYRTHLFKEQALLDEAAELWSRLPCAAVHMCW